jgi:hypothetical protein
LTQDHGAKLDFKHVIIMEAKGGSYKGTAGLHKRKAEEEMGSDKEKSRRVGSISTKPSGIKITSASNLTATAKNGLNTAPKAESPPATPSAPKPGSYKALLAKAAVVHEAQKAKNPTGGVRHKNHREQQRKREEEARLAAREKAKAKGKPLDKTGTSTSTPSSKDKSNPSHVTKPRPPSPPKSTYKGTAGLGRPTQSKPIVRKQSVPGGPPLRRREYYSDDEEDEEHEHYYDSDTSDMEAGMGDIDEEEEAALLAAQLEDKREREREEGLKREKEARKKEAMKKSIHR